MSFTQLKTTQKQFLEQYLRGTGRGLTSRDAAARFGILNLRARVCELRQAGLVVRTEVSSTGRARYEIISRDADGSRARRFTV